MRRILLKLHLFAGLAAAVFAITLGATGALMAFEDDLDHALHPELFRVTPQPQVLSLAEIGAAAQKVFPGDRVAAYGLSVSPDLPYSVSLRSGTVFVDQYTGRVLGVRQGPTFLSRVHQLHLRLLWQSRGDMGKAVVSWAGVAILFLSCSGLYLWWPLKRVTVKWGAAPARVWFDLHSAIGFFSSAVILVLALTGVLIGFERRTVPFFYSVTHSEPLPTSFTVARPAGGASLTPDRAVEIARAALPGAVPISVNVPAPAAAYRIAARYPEDLTPGGRSRIHVDPYTGTVLLAESSRTTAAGTRLVILNRAVHTGDILGMPSKTVMSLASVLLVVQAVSGVTLWWKRRTPQRRAQPAAAAR